MKNLNRFQCMLLIVVSIFAIKGAIFCQTVQLGLDASGSNLIISAKPNTEMVALFTGSAFTIRWLDSYGVSLGAVTSSFSIVKGGTETVMGVYKYQKFYQTDPKPINWTGGLEYQLMSIPVNQTGAGTGLFELAPVGFLTDGVGDPYIEIDTYDQTNYESPFYQSSTPIAMPVELTAFTVTPDKQGATLAWKTATEKDNARFDIERTAIGGPDVPKKWAMIGSVDGGGTTNAPKQYTYRNKNVQTGKYAYRLKQIDRDGGFRYSQEVEAVIAPPSEFALSQNYPNPFNPSTTVNFSLARKSAVTIKVYDITGREVRTVMQEEREAGYYSAVIDGHMMASGVYLYRMTAVPEGGKAYTETKRLMLLK